MHFSESCLFRFDLHAGLRRRFDDIYWKNWY